MGRQAAQTLWPMLLQMWEQHPWIMVIVIGVVAIGVAVMLSYLWEIVRPIPWQPHEAYRPPKPDDAE
jgi:hypothetical protein